MFGGLLLAHLLFFQSMQQVCMDQMSYQSQDQNFLIM
jgi:hypothetical protein